MNISNGELTNNHKESELNHIDPSCCHKISLSFPTLFFLQIQRYTPILTLNVNTLHDTQLAFMTIARDITNCLALVQTMSSNIVSGVKLFCSKCCNMFLIDLENTSIKIHIYRYIKVTDVQLTKK